jgi:hypothetical protein
MVLGQYRCQLMRRVNNNDPAVQTAISARFESFGHYIYESANASVLRGEGSAAVVADAPTSAYHIFAQKENKACLEIIDDIKFHAGQSYVFPMNFIHRIIDESGASGDQEGAITLMISAPSVKSKSNFYSRHFDGTGEDSVDVPRFTPDVVRARLLHVLDCLEAGIVLRQDRVRV